ncbi:unnamed protein product [Mytilus coruscus]|uniref:DDE Tnp4 domain-containing protein n=1 Tax=Mytilus coruscus TaxID=42192 RepID=A0A6J8C3T8_MYTCO|nr:unnamed protein product [Mytilus coruscus]
MERASQNIADLQEQMEYYEGKRFTLHKIKDDNDAISFYTGFQNYGVFNSVFNNLEIKASRLQYWRGQSDRSSDFKQYQTRWKRPGPKRKLTLVEEFFYCTHEAERLLDKGDNVMADRGFEIEDILLEGITLNIPPFKRSNRQLKPNDVEDTINIAYVRIHVERAIGRIKNYHILDGILPLSLSHVSNQIVKVVSFLTCFLPPVVPLNNDQNSIDEVEK